jgi:hypothetical protein
MIMPSKSKTKKTKLTTKIEFVEHPTAKSVIFGFFRYDHPRMSDEKLMNMKTDFHVFMGKKWIKPARVCELLALIKVIGVWGYHNPLSSRHKEIHFWVGKHANKDAVVEFLVHELAHAGGFKSEELVQKIAGISAYAFHIYETDFANKIAPPKVPNGKHQNKDT